ncbi:MAG: winged helix-turn-helix domain-containing protein [Pyrinomonadaceae bacterium]
MVRWTRNDLRKKEFLDSPTHGIWQITDLGLAQINAIENKRVGASILDKESIISPENFEQQKKRKEEKRRDRKTW